MRTKLILKIEKKIADMALSVTRKNANSFCHWRGGQPEMPKGYEKLKK